MVTPETGIGATAAAVITAIAFKVIDKWGGSLPRRRKSEIETLREELAGYREAERINTQALRDDNHALRGEVATLRLKTDDQGKEIAALRMQVQDCRGMLSRTNALLARVQGGDRMPDVGEDQESTW